MTIFKCKRKKLDDELKTKLNGKRLYSAVSVKYLVVKIYENLTWQHHTLLPRLRVHPV